MAVTVNGYAGRNIVQDAQSFHSALKPSDAVPGPNTQMRVAIEHHQGHPGRPRLGAGRLRITLAENVTGWHVRWTGTVPVPKAPEGGAQRLLITEVETTCATWCGDRMLSIGPRDFVRERVVHADVFEL